MRTPLEVAFVECYRHPQLTPVAPELKFKLRRHHTDDGILLAVDPDRVPENQRVGAVASLPQTVTRPKHAASAVRLFIFNKGAAEHSLYVQHPKETGRSPQFRYLNVLTTCRCQAVSAPRPIEARHRFEDIPRC